jgi:transcriptional regulator with PAS, ATPase and Fis domain
VGVYITDNHSNTLGANQNYETLSGLPVGDVLGRSTRELEKAGFYDQSITLLALRDMRTVSAEQNVLRTGKRILVTSNPVFDQSGNIILVISIVYASKYRKLFLEAKEAKPSPVSTIAGVICISQTMRQVLKRATNAASTDATVLISGESGVGKEVVARLIHEVSPRKEKPFVKVNMTTIPEGLFESEMFGYRKGAFTGALKTGKPGLVQAAAGGTLFLDEISEISVETQAKLLRLIQEKEVLPLGSVDSRPVNLRFLAATNRDLRALVQSGRFREDLFYRLNVIPIHIPPIRERKEEIHALWEHFMGVLCRRYKTERKLASGALQALADYSWPGNVRELKNTVERVFALYSQPVISENCIVEELYSDNCCNPALQTAPPLKEGLQMKLYNLEKDLTIKAFKDCNRNLIKTAQVLGIHRTTLFRKLRKYGLLGPHSAQ